MSTIVKIMVFAFLFSSCKQLKLSNEEAKTLVTQTLNLPQRFSKEVVGTGGFEDISGKLEQAGYLTRSGSWLHGYSLYATDLGRQYLAKTGKDPLYGTSTLSFKTFDIDFGEITGISVDKKQKTAIVRFNLVATNITPIGRMTERNINNPRNGELIFKKFDNGWQLADNTKPALTLVRQIFWGNSE